MTDKIREIFTAWQISFDPNDHQAALAAKRLSICQNCEHKLKNRLGIEVCVQCGCPINKKVFSKEKNPCPESKWDFEL